MSPMIYDLPTVDPTAQPMQSFNAPQTENYAFKQGAEQAAALTRTGGLISQVATDLQNEIDTAVTKKADNRIAELARTAIYDPEKGYLLTNGENALKSRKSAIESLDKARDEARLGLQNDVQRAMFDKVYTQRRAQYMGVIDGHAIQQAKVFRVETSKARIDGFASDMMNNRDGYDRPDSLYTTAYGNLKGEINAYAAAEGWDEKKKQQFQREVETVSHVNIINQYLENDNAKGAKAYYDRAKKAEGIDPKQYDEIDKVINNGIAYVDGREFGQKVFADNQPDDINTPIESLEEKMIGEIESATDLSEQGKKYARASLDDSINRFNKQKRAIATSKGNELYDYMNGSGSYAGSVQMIKKWRETNQIDSATMENLVDRAKDHYDIRQKEAEARSAGRMQREMDTMIKMQVFMDDYANGKYGKMNKVDILKSKGGEFGRHTMQVANVVEKINNNAANPNVNYADFKRQLTLIYSTPEGKDLIGFDPNEKGNYNKVLQIYDHTLGVMGTAGEKGPGKQVSLNKAIDLSLQKGVEVPGQVWGTNKYQNYQAPALSKREKRALIIQKLQQSGRPVNEANINAGMQLLNKTYSKPNKYMTGDTEE